MTKRPDDSRNFGRSVLAILSGDITKVAADVIVNAANSAFAHGGGVDGAIRAAAGPELSGEMRRRYPAGTPTGTAVATGAYALPARWVPGRRPIRSSVGMAPIMAAAANLAITWPRLTPRGRSFEVEATSDVRRHPYEAG